ncbi:FAS1 domain-containing protein [Aspergillus cavernicola]|uniref:FAS1 domain-containing protein n=1 Tax=Aspergillus cavernicola TaxID=176166 RepID=A0ABR4HGB3_9EURO
MKPVILFGAIIPTLTAAFQDPLSYRSIKPVYTAPKPDNVTTLLDLMASRSDLSQLHEALSESGGFEEAFATIPTWDFTFFAPNNHAFAHTGRYFSTFKATPKGKWWLGNTIMHHYVANSVLKISDFNETYQRFQTATHLFIGAQVGNNNDLILNQVARVVESEIPVTKGIVHIIDRILEPAAQIHEEDLPWVNQAFIAGSCSNPALPYC